MHWVDRSAAIRNIAHELADRGWKLYGYTPDRSEMQTDYYAPAHWDGIAERAGFVVVVDIAAGYRVMLERSGRGPSCTHRENGPCTSCRGTGKETRSFPEMHGVNILTGERVQTLPETKAGDPCRGCKGTGERIESRGEYFDEPWPKFQANPPRKLWHVERDGKVLASGIGLSACATYPTRDPSTGERIECEAVRALVDRIEAACRNGNGSERASDAAIDPETISVTLNKEKNGVEIRFPEKPAREVIDTLKRNGWRWSPRSVCWYAKQSAESIAFANSLKG